MIDAQWQAFRAVVEFEGFSRAANALHMTQSAVSQQIKSLESYYGVPLVDRVGKRIRLTDAGRQLYPHVLRLEKLYRQANDSVQAVREEVSGELLLGASLTVGEYVLPKLMAAFQRRHPLVRFQLQVANTSAVYDWIKPGRLMIALVEGAVEEQEGLIAVPCGGDELWVVADPNTPLPSPVVPLAFLLSFPWVLREKKSGTRKALAAFFTAHGLDSQELSVTMELGSTEAVKSVVRQGGAVTALSSRAVEREVEAGQLMHIKLQEGCIKRHYSLLINQGKSHGVAVETFCRFVLASFNTDARLVIKKGK